MDDEKEKIKEQLLEEWEKKEESLRQEIRAELVADQLANAERLKDEAAKAVTEEPLGKMLSNLDNDEQEKVVNNLTADEQSKLKEALVQETVEDTPVSGRGLRPDGNGHEEEQKYVEGSTDTGSSEQQEEINLDLINLIRDNPNMLDEMRDELTAAELRELEKIPVGGKAVRADDLPTTLNNWIIPPHLLNPKNKE